MVVRHHSFLLEKGAGCSNLERGGKHQNYNTAVSHCSLLHERCMWVSTLWLEQSVSMLTMSTVDCILALCELLEHRHKFWLGMHAANVSLKELFSQYIMKLWEPIIIVQIAALYWQILRDWECCEVWPGCVQVLFSRNRAASCVTTFQQLVD